MWLSVRSNAARRRAGQAEARRAGQGEERHQHRRARRRHCVLVSVHVFMATDTQTHAYARWRQRMFGAYGHVFHLMRIKRTSTHFLCKHTLRLFEMMHVFVCMCDMCVCVYV